MKSYPLKNASTTLKNSTSDNKKHLADSAKIRKFLTTALAIGFGSVLLILSYQTEFIYFQKIVQVLFIVGSILLIKHLGESKTNTNTKKNY